MAKPGKYLTVEQLKPYAYQADADALAFFEATLPRASRLFDKLCSVKPGYFLEQATSAGDITVYGTGSQLLRIPPFYGTTPPTITMPEGYTAPDFVARGAYLLTTDSKGVLQTTTALMYPVIWPHGVPIIVNATWGFEFVPDDVIEAVAELTIAIWRSKDQAFLKAINLETMQVVAQAIPERVRLIASSYRAQVQIPAFV